MFLEKLKEKFYSVSGEKEHKLEIDFPEKNMSPQEKIFYALSGDGAQSYAGLFLRTGLRANEFKSAIKELVRTGIVEQHGYFFSEKNGATITGISSTELRQ